MQGLFNAPLQEEKSVVGVVLKGLMWSNLQGVLEVLVLFYAGPFQMAV